MAESYGPYLLEIKGTLSISDFHVGSGARLSLSTDAPLLRDEQQRPYLPASSLRGILRAHIAREAPLLLKDPGKSFCLLFGETPQELDEASDIPLASAQKVKELTGKQNKETVKSRSGRLRVFDSKLNLEAQRLDSEIRDHVKISQKFGAAEHGAKFDQEVAYAAALSFRMAYEGESPSDPELVLLQEAVRALEAGELRCGGKTGLGYGQITLQATQYAEFDRRRPEALSSWLKSRLGEEPAYAPGFAWPKAEQLESLDRTALRLQPFGHLQMTLQIQFEGPVLVRAPIPPVNPGKKQFDANKRADDAAKGLLTADHTFVQTGLDPNYYLPASSIRGVLRHQAARISTTLLGDKATAVAELFGETRDKTGRKGLIEVSSGQLVSDPKPVYLDHVAIDRITGFAADGKKFATCGLQSPVFKATIRMRFRPGELHLVALLGFVLRDLIDGMLWFGGATSRGYGFAKSATVTKSWLDWTPGDSMPAEFLPDATRESLAGRTRISVDHDIPFNSWFWQKAQQAWIDRLPASEAEQSK